jgi:hypothetical protein
MLQNRCRQTRQIHPQMPPEWFVLYSVCIDRCGMCKILFNHGCHLFAKFCVDKNGRHLKISSERAIVEISGPDRRDVLVDEHELLVQEARLVSIETNPKIA